MRGSRGGSRSQSGDDRYVSDVGWWLALIERVGEHADEQSEGVLEPVDHVPGHRRIGDGAYGHERDEVLDMNTAAFTPYRSSLHRPGNRQRLFGASCDHTRHRKPTTSALRTLKERRDNRLTRQEKQRRGVQDVADQDPHESACFCIVLRVEDPQKRPHRNRWAGRQHHEPSSEGVPVSRTQ